MKKFLLFLAGFTIAVSCNNESSFEIIDAYIPANLDEKAGAWKTYILSSANEISVAVPRSINDVAYKSAMDSLKTFYTASLNSEQKKAIEYWGAGSVYRWNEIARELAARYNLPPASNAEGKYPVPDANNPLADPKFPFANPPYTSRMLAYLSVAQYDALVSAWNYKYKYNRPAVYKVDGTISTSLPKKELPGYPAEASVVAAASFVVLSAMFPGEVPFLQSKLTECNNAQLWAGMHITEETNTGESLGRAVGSKIMARAKTDGMSAANNQALTAGMIEAAQKRGIIPSWISQETPARPPMLPNYGAVALWNFDKTTLSEIRPKLPYVVGSTEWQKELEELKNIQKNQTREQARIANFWADGAGSYTPPGHWHRIAANDCIKSKYSEVRTARTLALLATAEADAGIACWEAKYFYYTPRPQQFGLKTSVGLPNFPSYTSGHSTFSAAAATVLSYIFPQNAAMYDAYAKEASESRIYGLIHFRIDCLMGLDHGKKIGEYAVIKGKNDGSGL